jgi:hypothetical protein
MTGYQQVPLRHPAAISSLPLCPAHPIFWETTRFHRIPDRPGTADDIDGVAVRRYDLAGDGEALVELAYLEEEASQVTRYAVARAVDGGWPLEIEIERTTDLSEALLVYGLSDEPIAHAGVPATLFTTLRLSHIDDPTIEVAVPLIAG